MFCPEQVYAPLQSSNAPDAPLPQLLAPVLHVLAHVPEQVVPIDTCPPVHVPAPLHASLIIVCPLQVYVVPAHPVIE